MIHDFVSHTAMIKHILIPVDGSARSENAARQGVQLATALNARVTAFHLMPTYRAFDFFKMSREQFRDAVTARGDAILDFAQEFGVARLNYEYIFSDSFE
jgi:nucleotide-binding universal stress UspA family protein